MNYATSISPTDFRDFAKVRGWALVSEAVSDRLYVLNHPEQKYRQIILPMDTSRPDYDDAVRAAIGTLADVEDRPFKFIESSLMEAGSDTLRFGVSIMRHLDEGLPLSYAVRAMKGAENALRSAACSEVHRQPFHPKMKRTEAQKLIETAQMKHTEAGSFVLKIACPIDAIGADEIELEPRPPFVRRAMLGMTEAIQKLVISLEADKLDELVAEAKRDGASPLSSNLCEGLIAFQDEELKANLDFSVAWSSRIEAPPVSLREKIRIQWDYFPRIEQVRKALRPEQSEKQQPFIGTVDELKGDFGQGETMEGEVIFNLFVEGESVKAKAYLDPERHALAHKAYAPPKPFVKIAGLLHPGNQPRKLTEISAFEILPFTS